MCTSARTACCRATMCVATCSARSSTRNASSSTTCAIASSNSSGKRDMWTPFCDGSRSTVQSIVAAISFSRRPRPIRTAFWTPVTPARESPIRTVGGAAWRSSIRILCRSSMNDDATFARLVFLACHDVRTPLATVHGFVKTLERTVEIAPPGDRYLEMIGAASAQMAELLDKLQAVCHRCGGPATMTQRLVDGYPAPADGATIVVGALEQYEARCRACHALGEPDRQRVALDTH